MERRRDRETERQRDGVRGNGVVEFGVLEGWGIGEMCRLGNVRYLADFPTSKDCGRGEKRS